MGLKQQSTIRTRKKRMQAKSVFIKNAFLTANFPSFWSGIKLMKSSSISSVFESVAIYSSY